MADEFISQDEVDSLLKGVVDGPDAPSDDRGVRAYKFGDESQAAGSAMPALDLVNDRFARLLRAGLYGFMRRTPTITCKPAKRVRYSEFVGGLAVPTNYNLVSCKPLRGTTLFVFEPALVFHVVDTLFGGDGRFSKRVEGREFTRTEQQIIQRMLEIVFADCQKSWENLHPLRFEHVRSEMHPQFVSIVAPDDLVVVSTFAIDFGGQGGALHICMPCSTLEPIRTLVERRAHGDQTGPDPQWQQRMTARLQGADVEIVADLASTTMTLGNLMAMKAGDVLPIDLSPRIAARIDGIPVMECGYGELNGRYALRVERVLRPQTERLGEVNG